ncbi:hypothetical protein HN803_00510 [candidate division WWE3 bacterium]|jgi:hypothetical protein|nr:hypothetical protein [candidate division WWE3 bacterium]MBT7349266.1 hypothetical protein [candidate division WWE3 bacterium]
MKSPRNNSENIQKSSYEVQIKLDENSENILEVSNVILDSLDDKTCWGGTMDKNNPLGGHCRVVAAVTHSIFGGEINWAQINGKTDHYWNVLPSGKELDLTKGQFKESTVIPKGIRVTIDKTLSGPTMTKTYPVLLERVTKRLQT